MGIHWSAERIQDSILRRYRKSRKGSGPQSLEKSKESGPLGRKTSREAVSGAWGRQDLGHETRGSGPSTGEGMAALKERAGGRQSLERQADPGGGGDRLLFLSQRGAAPRLPMVAREIHLEAGCRKYPNEAIVLSSPVSIQLRPLLCPSGATFLPRPPLPQRAARACRRSCGRRSKRTRGR